MPTRNVVLTDRQAEMVDHLVETGRYQNASEVLREGLRLVEREAAQDKARLKALRDAAKVGIEDIEAGRFSSFRSEEALGRHLEELAEAVLNAGAQGSAQ